MASMGQWTHNLWKERNMWLPVGIPLGREICGRLVFCTSPVKYLSTHFLANLRDEATLWSGGIFGTPGIIWMGEKCICYLSGHKILQSPYLSLETTPFRKVLSFSSSVGYYPFSGLLWSSLLFPDPIPSAVLFVVFIFFPPVGDLGRVGMNSVLLTTVCRFLGLP